MSSVAPLIAVLDDEPEMRKALGRLLLTHGFRVGAHATGEELLGSLSSGLPDCVVLDLHMPGVNGFDVLAQFASRWPHVPIVVITAFDRNAGAVKRAMDAGANEIVFKPIDLKKLQDVARIFTNRAPKSQFCQRRVQPGAAKS